MWNYDFSVPKNKQIRLLVYTDCANEADDQYALAHILMTPKFAVQGIIAGHFNLNTKMEGYWYKNGETAQASYDEICKVVQLMGLEGKYPIALGASYPLENNRTPILSAGAKMIIKEAMKEDERPLFIGCQGSLTDLASAILLEPRICEKMTAIWIGGGDYPKGGFEFNCQQDILAANVLFSSKMPVWQIPMKVYKTLSVSLAELQLKVKPCGKIGAYLFSNLIALNEKLAHIPHWPHGELWGLGDQGVISVLMQESERVDNFSMISAPRIDLEDMHYIFENKNREIRVYHSIDYRLTLEDFFAKLWLNFRKDFYE
ncbi:MAG: nucleoside hydrolase [Bacillota bacterium]|nr:nucleoside hydrolase [Bacillota bacterium]